MKMVIDNKVIPTNLIKHFANVVVTEEFQIFLSGDGVTLIRTARVLQVGAI